VVPDVNEELARLSQVEQRLRHSITTVLKHQQDWLTSIRSRPVLTDPTATFALRHEQIATLKHRAQRAISTTIERESTAIDHHLARVRSLSPKATLERGYSILVGPDGHALTSVAELDEGDDLLAYLMDGQLVVEVRETRPGTRAS
jgi:exodeoxyribonuclease VII large subunit